MLASPTPEGYLVWEVAPGGPAEKAGVRVGDIVTTTQISPKRYLSTESVRPLTIMREGRLLEASIKPEISKEPVVLGMMFPENIAYVKITHFSLVSSSTAGSNFIIDLNKALLSLQSPRGWILDLRGNVGGDIAAAALVAGDFGLSGNFVVVTDRYGSTQSVPIQSGDFTKGAPLAVLIDESTQSSAEMLASALQLQSGRARVVGTKSSGNVTAAEIYDVGTGALQITVGRVTVYPSTLDINGIGVSPDRVIRHEKDALLAGKDLQLIAAIELLTRS